MNTLQPHPLFREGTPQEENRKYLKIFSKEVKENWSLILDGGLIPGQTG
jgi:hypothetical protein